MSVAEEALKLVEERIGERWAGRLGFVRGFFLGDSRLQLQRLQLLLRHLRDYRRLERALFYHRYATNLLLAYRLGVLKAVQQQGQTATQVAERCKIHPNAAGTFLRVLESQKIVERAGDRFVASEFARWFLTEESPVSMLPMFEICETYAWCFPAFFEAARTGTIPKELDVFDDRGRVDALLDGVNYYLDQAGRELLARVEWPGVKEVIVGSMGVSFSSLVLHKFPEARITYGCLPHLVERIPRLRELYGVDPLRVVEMHEHGGEPDEDRWGDEAFDLVFLTKKMILDPENGLGDKFARKTFEVLNPGGAAVFWETIHETKGATPLDRALESFLDFGVSPTAPLLERKRFVEYLEDIGFVDVQIIAVLEGATSFVVARKS